MIVKFIYNKERSRVVYEAAKFNISIKNSGIYINFKLVII